MSSVSRCLALRFRVVWGSGFRGNFAILHFGWSFRVSGFRGNTSGGLGFRV